MCQYDSVPGWYKKEFFTPIRFNTINKNKGQTVRYLSEGVAKVCYEFSGNSIQLHLTSVNDFPLLSQYNLTAAIY